MGKTRRHSRRWRRPWAHPRSRGENMLALEWCVVEAGSSPLTWGKLLGPRVDDGSRGLIPAHVGKTGAGRRSACRCRAHPRSRGENGGREGGEAERAGSSPLTWGKLRSSQSDRLSDGLIPAHVGKTTRPATPASPSWAHPRSRGENPKPPALAGCVWGSSPLTWGKPIDLGTRGRRDRLIPAHVGKTTRPESRSLRTTAHPRSRGENGGPPGRSGSPLGSSPLTWGKPRSARPRTAQPGLIPAHVGKTRRVASMSTVRPAHPRSRGENGDGLDKCDDLGGSSPLTWGKPQELPNLLDDLGLIPAHVGKTLPDLRFYRADRSDLGNP